MARPSRSSVSSRGNCWVEGVYHDPAPIGGIAGGLLLGTAALTGTSVSGPLLVAAVCGTALVYALDRAVAPSPEDDWNHPRRRAWVQRHWAWLIVEGGLLLAGGAGALLYLSGRTLLVAAVLAGAAGAHLLPGLRSNRLRTVQGVVKPFLVAAAWAAGSTLLPLVETGTSLSAVGGGVFVYRFLLVLPNVLLSDWGDRAGDRAAGLRPWPAWGSVRVLRRTATALLLVAAVGAVGLGWATGRWLLFGVDAVGPLLMTAAVWRLDPTRPDHRFWLDAVVAWPAVTALVGWGGA